MLADSGVLLWNDTACVGHWNYFLTLRQHVTKDF